MAVALFPRGKDARGCRFSFIRHEAATMVVNLDHAAATIGVALATEARQGRLSEA